MDFEEFRKKRKEKEEALKSAKEANDRAAASGKPLDWVEGMGPQGPTNPKIKNFVLGRFRRKKVDPSQLERPKGYESTSMSAPEAETVDVELARRKAALERAEVELRAAEEKRRLEEIAKRRAEDGFSRPKGIRKF